MTWTWRAWLALAVGTVLCGCLPPGDGDGDGDGDVWFEFGHLSPDDFQVDGSLVDDPAFVPLEGEAADMITGGQGLVMLALPIRAGGFAIDPNASKSNSDDWPELNAHIDVEGHNTGIGGHFWRIANYPVWFDAAGDDEYAFFFLTVLVPDESPLPELEGLPAHLEATLQPPPYAGSLPAAEGEWDFVIGAQPE